MMKTSKLALAMMAALVATVSRAGDSAPFRIDTRQGPRVARATEPLAYSTEWNVDTTGATIALNGATLFSAAAPASGDYALDAYNVAPGLHSLTFNDGVETLNAQFEVRGVSFDTTGGAPVPASQAVFCDSPYGRLPVASRTGYSFDGWSL